MPSSTPPGRRRRRSSICPPKQKQRARAPYPGYPYGYLGPQLESLAKSRNVDAPPDLKESFNGGPARPPEGMTDPEALAFCYAATIWPETPRRASSRPGRPITPRWRNLAARDHAAVRARRCGLPEDYFDGFIDAPVSALRALNYPRQDAAPGAGPDPRGRPHRLRQPDDPAAAGRLAGAWKF